MADYIDTHSHLYLSDFSGDIDECISRCKEKHIIKVVLPNIDSKTVQPMLNLENKDPELFLSLIGLHPTHVKEGFEDELNQVLKAIDSHPFKGIGEIGIDLYWDKTFISEQRIVFEQQVRAALQRDLPVVIHARESYQEIIDVLKKINSNSYRGIFHAFPGNAQQAKEVIEMGFALGIGGVATFKNSHLPEVIKQTDLNHIVLETDSPYLAPVPFRGKRNESSYIPIIAEKVALLSGASIEEVATKTTKKACQIFNL
jgi:TatD DNase family protein